MSFNCKTENGFGLMEGLATIALTAILLTMVASQFIDVSRQSYDQRIRMTADEEARILLDILAYDIRMTGAGMPIGQSNFAPGASGLGDAPLPILTSSDSDTITLRLNERGAFTALASSFSPSGTSLTFDVTSAADFLPGDTVYLSDMMAGGDDGLKGVVASVSGNSITLENSFVSGAGAVFPAGSAMHRVSEITFAVSGSTVTRAVNGATEVLLQPRSNFQLEYQDRSGAAISIPLSTSEISEDLARIVISVSVTGSNKLRTGSSYVATATETIALRNLVE